MRRPGAQQKKVAVDSSQAGYVREWLGAHDGLHVRFHSIIAMEEEQ